MTRKITEAQMVKHIREKCEVTKGGQSGLATKLKVSVGLIGDILKGRRSVSEDVANRLGFKRTIVFEEKA